MPFVHGLDEIRLVDRAWAGEKAARLGELIGAGFEVPRGFCVTAEAYHETLTANQIQKKILTRLAATEIDDPVDLEQAAEEIRGWIENAAIPSAVATEILVALGALKPNPLFAVRASRVVEDVPNPAASGLQQAYLAVPPEAVLDHVRKCWSSPWNSRAIYFRNRKKIDQGQLRMAVVIQPMLSADAAGVLFTADPLTGAPNEIHIDATWGLGEAIIAARWKPDHFVIEKNSPAGGDRAAQLAIRDRAIATKTVMELVSPEGGLQTVGVPEEKQDMACLSDAQIEALASLSQKVQAHFNAPQDIEWCRVGDKLFLLQTRPLARG